jgi:hypothetical protein
VSAYWDALDASTNPSAKGELTVRQVSDPSRFLVFQVTGAVTAGSGYRKVPVAHVAGDALPDTDAEVGLGFARAGDKGADGAGTGDVSGPAGATDNALVRWDGATGKLVKDSSATLSDGGDLAVNGTLSADGVYDDGRKVLTVGKFECPLPAGAWKPRTSNGCGTTTAETSTNKVMVETLDFDAAAKEYAQFRMTPPKGWDGGTVTFRVKWKHGATTTNFGVAFGLSGVCVGDDEALDAAFGTEVAVTDTGGTDQREYTTAESGPVTLAGTPAKGETVLLQLARLPADVADTLAVDAQVTEVIVTFTLDAENDA